MKNPLKGFINGLTDAARKRFDINITPQDFKEKAPVQDETDLDIVAMVMKDYKKSAELRMVWEREGLQCQSYADGNQWSMYREICNNLPGYKDVEDPFRAFMQDNQLSKMVEGVKVSVTSTDPDITLQPVTMRAQDVGAADEASDIKAHLDLLHDWGAIRDRAVNGAIVWGWGFIFHFWNPDAEAVGWKLVPDNCPTCQGRGASGPFWQSTPCPTCQGTGKVQVQQAYVAKLGEVQRCFVPGREIYGDPDAESFGDWRYLYHVKRRPLAYIREHYPYGGKWVEPGGNDSFAGAMDAQLAAIAGESVRGGTQDRDLAYVITRWEKPTDVFPNGRRITVANGRLLTDPKKMDWPFEKTDAFPFVPIYCHERDYSSYPVGLVRDAVGLQQGANELLSRTVDQIKESILTVLNNSDTHVHPGDMHNRQNMRMITYDGPTPPQIQLPPPPSPAAFEMMDSFKMRIQDKFSYHDVSEGKDGNAESGVQLELQQQQDQTGNNQLLRSILLAAQDSTDWCLALAAQYYAEPRMVAIGSSPDPNQNQIAAHDFRNLQAGGRVRVKAIPGSNVGTSPAARDQKLLGMAQAGMFDPDKLAVTIVFLKLMQLNRDDTYIRELIQVCQQQQAMAAAQIPAPLQVEQARQSNAMALLQTKQQGDQTLQTLKNTGVVEGKKQDWIARSQVVEQEFQNEQAVAAHETTQPNISISLKGALGTQGVEGAEIAAGLPERDSAESLSQEQEEQAAADTASQVAVKSVAPPQKEPVSKS